MCLFRALLRLSFQFLTSTPAFSRVVAPSPQLFSEPWPSPPYLPYLGPLSPIVGAFALKAFPFKPFAPIAAITETEALKQRISLARALVGAFVIV